VSTANDPAQPALVLQLHGHLPWVNHPEYEHFLEEDWFFEGVADCYLPLLAMLDGWERDGVNGAYTMGVSPPLLSMMQETSLLERTARYLDGRLQLASRYLARLPGDSPFRRAAEHARDEADKALSRFEAADRNLPAAFRHHWDAGRVELITCAVTHGLFPVLLDEGSAHAQVAEAIKAHERGFGRRPRGMWQPECGIHPSTYDVLAAHNIAFSFTEDRAILYGAPPPAYGVYRPTYTPEGVALFARDPVAGKEVWSADEGYPGDFRYREFYRDLGYDAQDELLDEVHKQGTGDRKNVGVKLHRITGRVSLDEKQPYDPAEATRTLAAHAAHFVDRRVTECRRVRAEYGASPCITAAFDAELFGHWWYEGPAFLDLVVRAAASRAQTEADCPQPMSAWQYLDNHSTHQVQEPAVSSWGDGGDFRVWVSDKNDWLWRRVHDARLRLGDAVERGVKNALEDRVLKQATRELLLGQSSDWPFILQMDTQAGYAARRPIEHLSRAHRLLEMLENHRVDEADLAQMEERDGLLPDVDPTPFGMPA
jgi:1,4-alpha-glucan branching enzyme